MINFLKIIRFLKVTINHKTILKVLSIVMLAGAASCNNSKEAPPFPTLENEYEQPKTKSFEFSAPDTIKWLTKDAAEIKPLPTKKFSWDKLPTKPFDIGTPYLLTSPMPTQDFDWNNLPSTPFNLDNLEKRNLNVKVIALGEPRVVDAEYPTSLPQSSRGVTTIDSNFGLSSTTQSLLKDSDGMLWFGTTNAIAKYDTERLEIYGSEQGLITGTVYTLFEDSKGRIWVGNTTNTVSVIDFDAKLIYEISSSFNTGPVYYMLEAKDGKFWLSNNRIGYNIIDFDAKTIQQFNQKDGLSGSFTITPFQDKDGLIWLTTYNGLNVLDLEAGKNISITEEHGFLRRNIQHIYQDDSGRMWISTYDGINIIDASKTTVKHFTPAQGLIDSKDISWVSQDKSGKFLIGSVNGQVFRYNESTLTLERFDLNFGPGNLVYNVVEDNQDQIWAAVVQGGIYKIDFSSGRPANFTTQHGLRDNQVWSTLETQDGKIWIGTYNGIDIYDQKTQTIKHLDDEHGLLHTRNPRLMEDSQGRVWACGNLSGVSIIDPKSETIQQLTTNEGLYTGAIQSILETNDGIMWMGGSASEFIKVDLENETFNYHLPDSTVAQVQNNILINDHTGKVWVGTVDNGVQIIDPKTNIRQHLTTSGGLISDRVYSLTMDKQNNIWTASHGGIERINPLTNEITAFTSKEGLGASDVYAIIENNGEIYAGTSNGLSILKPETIPGQSLPHWNVKTLGQRQGLNWVDFAENSFTVDKNGRFWAGVDAQILTVMEKLKTNKTAYPTYITGINILDNEQTFENTNTLLSKRASIDTLWIPGQIKPQTNTVNSTDSSLLKNSEMTWRDVEGAYNMPVGLELSPNQNFISFNYSALQYNNPDKVVYRYFLEGIDKAWSPISSQSSSENYRDLHPGDYTFKVASKGFNGIWGPPAEFNFTIMPPWWQTKWAYGLYFLLLLLLARVVHTIQKKRTLRKERERSQKRELEQAKVIEKAYEDLKATQAQLIQSEKMASLGELTAGIAHEIQNPLNFVNNFSEINMELIDEMQDEIKSGNTTDVISLSNDIKANQEKINHHGKRADAIVKGMLQHSRNSSSERHLTNINDLADEYLRLAYHGLRAKDKSFNAKMKTDFDAAIGKINIVPQDMGRVILNLITNAFYAVNEKKQQEKKDNQDYDPTVTVSSKLENNKVVIAVKDNGEGIPQHILDKIFQPFYTTKPSGEGTGLGLSLSYDIVKTHGGELLVDTRNGEGTTFKIVIPAND